MTPEGININILSTLFRCYQTVQPSLDLSNVTCANSFIVYKMMHCMRLLSLISKLSFLRTCLVVTQADVEPH